MCIFPSGSLTATAVLSSPRIDVYKRQSLVCIYSAVVLFYKFFGRTGLYMWTVIATISANIEVLILVDAFGMEQTLGLSLIHI